MRLSGLTGPHLARLSPNRKGRIAAPAKNTMRVVLHFAPALSRSIPAH
jgi:hypothetical protein